MSGHAPVKIRIDVLSLPAGLRDRGAAIGDALRAELARAFGDVGTQARLRAHAASAIDAGSLRLRPAERGETIGRRIGAQVATGLLSPTQPRGRR